jgi:hypothetical protein
MKLIAGLLLAVVTSTAIGQQLPTSADSAVARAMQFAADNDTTAARRVLDSLS